MGNLNPFLSKWETPFSSVPFDEIRPEHFLPALEKSVNIHNKEIDNIVSNPEEPTFENTILAFEKAGNLFSKVTLIFSNLESAYFHDNLKDISKEFRILSSNHSTQIILNEKLFGKIKNAYENVGVEGEDLALLKKIFRDFEEAGANCHERDKDEFLKINSRISVLKDKFSKNLQKERGKYLLLIDDDSLIPDIPEEDKAVTRKLAESRGKEGFGFIPNRSLYPVFMKYCIDRKLREKFFRDFRKECCHGGETDNREIVKEIVNLRLRRAQLLGFSNHSETVLKNRMLKTKEEVVEQTQNIFDAALPRARNDVKKIFDFTKRTEGNDFELMPWDFVFYSEKYKKNKFDFNSSDVKPYFELKRVIDGVFNKAKEMYGISFSIIKNISVYDKNIIVYEVLDDAKHMGLLYLDLFSNPEVKSDGAWMTESVEESKFPNIQRPHVHICTNYNKSEGRPCLLTQDEVETFLHEFGHALHGLLSDVKYSSISGTAVARDFVEFPSQIMENFFFEKEFLDTFAKHYENGEVIPDNLFKKILLEKEFNKGFWYSRQAALTMIDNYWHTIEKEFNGDVLSVEEEILKKLNLFPIQMLRYRTVTFLHPFSSFYDMGYYSYANSEILDVDMFKFWKENGFSKGVFSSFRKHILSRGASCNEKEMYRKVVGRLPEIESFLDARVREPQ